MARQDALFDMISTSLEGGQAPEIVAEELWERFGEIVAVLVLDSTGFTRTTQARGIAYFLTVIARLRRVGERELVRYGALDWRAEADNLFASFPDVDHAVAAAFAIHRALGEAAVPLVGEERLGACIGIGYGRLLRSDHEGHYGDQMNLASKLGEDTAKAGETLLTEAAYSALHNSGAFHSEQRTFTLSGVTAPYYALS